MTVFRTFWLSEPTIEGINPKQNLLLYQLDPATYFMQKNPCWIHTICIRNCVQMRVLFHECGMVHSIYDFTQGMNKHWQTLAWKVPRGCHLHCGVTPFIRGQKWQELLNYYDVLHRIHIWSKKNMHVPFSKQNKNHLTALSIKCQRTSVKHPIYWCYFTPVWFLYWYYFLATIL